MVSGFRSIYVDDFGKASANIVCGRHVRGVTARLALHYRSREKKLLVASSTRIYFQRFTWVPVMIFRSRSAVVAMPTSDGVGTIVLKDRSYFRCVFHTWQDVFGTDNVCYQPSAVEFNVLDVGRGCFLRDI